MTAYWLALGFSLFVLALALLATFRPPDLGKLDERQTRNYRLGLEGRGGLFAAGNLVIVALAILWLIFAIEEAVLGSIRGLAYLVPALVLMTTLWLMRRYRANALRRLGDRGLVPRTAAEEKAKVWQRLWGAVAILGFIGSKVMEFHFQRSFSTEEPRFLDAASTVHLLLSILLIIGVSGLLITHLRTRKSEKEERGTPRDQPPG